MKMRSTWITKVKFTSLTVLFGGAVLLAFLGIRGTSSGLRAATAHHASETSGRTINADGWAERYGNLPLSFEENRGQTSHDVRYLAHGGAYSLLLTSQEAVLAMRPRLHLDFSPRGRFATLRALREARRNPQATPQMTVVRMQLENANPHPQISAIDRLPGNVNYFIGNNRKDWHTDVPTYTKVKYAEVYPGVDLIYYGNQKRIEYDFIVAPGADPSAINLKLDGARKLHINARGDLMLSLGDGELEFQKPLIYQQVNGQRLEVSGKYTLKGNRQVAFSVARYDRSQPLIVDPVLIYSTYIGGSTADNATSIAVDNNGDAFIAGISSSTDFPTTSNAYQQVGVAGTAAFVTEVNPTGTALLYSSYIEGSAPAEFAFGVAADPTGKAVYVTGQTLSSDFPTTTAQLSGFKTGTNSGAATIGTSFLVKFDPTQTTGANSFLYSTFIGGTSGTIGDVGQAVAADSNGVAYVTGLTDSGPGTATDLTTYPIVGGFQSTLNSTNGGGNAFLAKIDTTVSGAASLISSSYLGGSTLNFTSANSPGFGDAGFGVAVDSSANAYIVWTTTSTDLIANGQFTAYPGSNNSNAAFFAKINTATAGTMSLSYLTYLGGTGPDFGFAVGVGPNNVAYVAGSTSSLNFPITTGAYQVTGQGTGVAYVSLIDTSQPAASSLTRSTFIGGTGGDDAFGIKADSQGNAYLAGSTSSPNFPVTQGPLQPAKAVGSFENGFVSKLDPTLSTLLYSTYFGGSGDTNSQDPDTIAGLAIDSSSPPNVFITGQTSSSATSFPVSSGAFQTTLKNGSTTNAYVAKFSLIPTLVVAPSPFNFGTLGVGTPSTAQAFTVTNNTASGVTFNSITTTGVSPAANTDFAISSNGCGLSVAAAAPPCAINVIFTPSVAALESATLVINATVTNGGQASTEVFNVNLTGTGTNSFPAVTLDHANVTFTGQMVTTTSAATTVNLKNTGTGALTINASGISTTGDFAQTNNCPASPQTLAAGSSCAIQVKFAPTATGTRNGTLSITDNATGSPQSIPLTGTGWDFSLTGPTTTQTATPSSPAKFNVTMTPLGGFNQLVAITCTASTPMTTCSAVSPVSAADGTTPQQSQVTVSTSAMTVPPTLIPNLPLSPRQVVPLILLLTLLFLLPRTKRLQVRLGLVVVMLALITIAACGTHTSTGSITITGQSTGSAGSVSHTATVQITTH